MIRPLTALAFLLAILVSTAAFAEEKLPPPPWHLIDLWWDLGREEPLERYDVTFTVHDKLPDDVRVYIAPIGLGHLDGTPFYGGIQTRADGHTRKDQRIRVLGRGILMSRWNERSLDAIRPPQGGHCQSSGHEGDFISVRRPYEWSQGTYTYSVVGMDAETVDGKPHRWYGVYVYAHAADEHIFAGALRFPGERPTLKRSVASFVEIYGPRIPLGSIPKFRVSFDALSVNGKRIEKPGVVAVYPRRVPDYAVARVDAGRVLVTVGEPIQDRADRQERLLPTGN